MPVEGLVIWRLVIEKLRELFDRCLRLSRNLPGRPTDEPRNVEAVRFGKSECTRERNLQNNGEDRQKSGGKTRGATLSYSFN